MSIYRWLNHRAFHMIFGAVSGWDDPAVPATQAVVP
jgi:hypothetical protein